MPSSSTSLGQTIPLSLVSFSIWSVLSMTAPLLTIPSRLWTTVEELQALSFKKRGPKLAFGLVTIVINYWLESMYYLAYMLAKKAIIFALMYRNKSDSISLVFWQHIHQIYLLQTKKGIITPRKRTRANRNSLYLHSLTDTLSLEPEYKNYHNGFCPKVKLLIIKINLAGACRNRTYLPPSRRDNRLWRPRGAPATQPLPYCDMNIHINEISSRQRRICLIDKSPDSV